MSDFLILMLLGFIAGLMIFVLQNISPALPLVFLGMKTVALPLSVWILLALGAGALTSWFISMLLGVPSQGRHRSRESDLGQKRRTVPQEKDWRRDEALKSSDDRSSAGYREAVALAGEKEEPVIGENAQKNWGGDRQGWRDRPMEPYPSRVEVPEDDADPEHYEDEEDENWVDEGEDETYSEVDTPKYAAEEEFKDKKREYEVSQKPKSESWSGSIYSFRYRDSHNNQDSRNYQDSRNDEDSGESEEEATESVHDADYRVIITPSQPPQEKPSEKMPPQVNDDDWSKSNNPTNDWE